MINDLKLLKSNEKKSRKKTIFLYKPNNLKHHSSILKLNVPFPAVWGFIIASKFVSNEKTWLTATQTDPVIHNETDGNH